jgi:16S rRNA (guanine966-N2)-methyltransferase
VTRIVAGRNKGRQLSVPAGGAVRPTTDRVREALFSTLSGLVDWESTRVLDLFAGSGALGLEAISRGSPRVRLIERDARVAAVLRRNCDLLGEGRATVQRADVRKVLARPADETFDLVLADPPYTTSRESVESMLGLVVGSGWLREGIVVVERPTREEPLGWPSCLVQVACRGYGETTLWYGRAAGPGREAGELLSRPVLDA